jgi:alpha-L-glutamate ligase-like protein
MNARNSEFIALENRRRLYPLVDDKARTKRLAAAAGIAVPELYGLIDSDAAIRGLDAMVEGRPGFVVKPAHGSGGNGILVITEIRNGRFLRSNGTYMDREQLGHHVSNVLSGMYSLGGRPDQALIERRIEFDDIFADVTFQGVPDIRTIVYRGVPVAAMARLPTRSSDGKANLHQGAVGAGIDLATGSTTTAVCRSRPVELHPDTLMPIRGIRIPNWRSLLELAASCYEMAPLGYLGVDIVLDRTLGPLVLELNARPGLAIQLANRRGLRTALERVRAVEKIPKEPAARVALAIELLA